VSSAVGTGEQEEGSGAIKSTASIVCVNSESEEALLSVELLTYLLHGAESFLRS